MDTLSKLVISAQQGDLDAFSAIVVRFQAMAYASACVMVHDAQLAEDVAQEAFIEAYVNLPKLREPAAFPGWRRWQKHKGKRDSVRTKQPMPANVVCRHGLLCTHAISLTNRRI